MKEKTPVIVSSTDWQNLIGIQFALGGSDPAIGLNCYGLVREVYRGLQIELPEHQETALDGSLVTEAAGADWTRIDTPTPYAVALIRSTGNLSRFHLAVVTPELSLLHALPKKGVVVSPVELYEGNILGFYRYTPGCGERFPVSDGNVGRLIGGILIAVAAIAAATATGGMSIFAAEGMLAGWGGVAGALAGAAVSLAGNMILNAVAPIKTDLPQLSGWGGDLADSRSYTWDGIMNESRQGLSKAKIFGRMKCGGQIISEKTWFDGDNNEYLDMLICPAVGRVTRFTGLQINDTDVSLYKNTAAVFRPGDDQQTPIDMFHRIYLQYSSAAKIPYDASATNPAQSVQFSTKGAVSGIRLTVTAPNGIYEMPGSVPIPHDVTFHVQYRPTGGAWAALPTVDPDYAVTHPFIHSPAGLFAGSANPYTLTDGNADFAAAVSPGAFFELIVSGVTYYCTQEGTLTESTIVFSAFTDEGKTAPLVVPLPLNAPYVLADNSLVPYTGTVRWTQYATDGDGGVHGYEIDIVPLSSFQTDVAVRAISCRLVIESSTITWARMQVKYKKVDGDWMSHDIFEVGYPVSTVYHPNTDSYTTVTSPPIGSASRNISITGLETDEYVFAVVLDNSEGGTPDLSNFRIDRVSLDTASVNGVFEISADRKNPMHLVGKEIEVRGLAEAVYDFRIWRTTADETKTTWQDDIFLRGYSEIVNRTLAYPGHALIGVRAMATDRIYGGRPREPLTVPVSGLRYDTTSAADAGAIDTYALVNGVIVTGMRKVLVNAQLPAADGSYFWLVRMDSDGYAQPDRLLTKHCLRVHTWEAAGAQTYVYLQDAEPIPDGTDLMLFNEGADPYVSRHTAWAVAKMLIDGSHGRITAGSIDWEAFSAWDAWNMQTKAATGQPRHLFDAVVDFNTDLWSLAMRTATTARGNLMKKGSKYSVWIDKAATHRQVFGEGNSKNVSVNPIPRSDRANILTTSFADQAANFEQKDISIEDVQESEYPIVKNMPVQVGVVRESQVTDLLQYMLLQNRYVGSTVSLEAGIDSIEVTIGDVFITASQAKDFSLSGRLVSVDPGVGAELDQPFTPEDGVTYKLTVWGTDGTLYTWTGALTGTGITTVPAPAGLVDAGYYEHPYVLCKLTAERMKYRCIGARRVADTMHATLTGIEYRDEVYQND